MSLRDKILGRPEDLAAYKNAKKALHDHQRAERAIGITEETPEYLRLNTAVNEAMSRLPWWRR